MDEIREIIDIPDKYKDCLTFNPILRLVEKHMSCVSQGAMNLEFKYIIESILEINLLNVELHPNWTIIECNGNDNENYLEFENDYQHGFCICGHPIKNLNYITYKPMDITFKVGMDCVKKMGIPSLYKELQNLISNRKKRKKKQKHQTSLPDKSKKPTYNPVSKWKINFGKYKGQTYRTLKFEYKSYVRWLLDNQILEKCFFPNWPNRKPFLNRIIEYLKDV